MRTGLTVKQRAALTLIGLMCLGATAGCRMTRVASSPERLTQAAIRYELTKISRQTERPFYETRSAASIANGPSPTLTPRPTAAAAGPSDSLSPTETAIPIIAFDPSAAAPRPTETPRNVFPSDLSITSEPIYLSPVPDDPFLVPGAEHFAQSEATIPPTATPLPDLDLARSERKIYITQNGDTLQNVAARFGTAPERISALFPIPGSRFLNPNLTLFVESPSDRQYESAVKILPDEYIVFASTASNYDIENEILKADGFLARYTEETSTGTRSGIEIVRQVAQDYSINPMILLALIEFRSHWLFGEPNGAAEHDYPVGWHEAANKGLYKQVAWAANTLSTGYYGWRGGTLSEIPYYRNPKPIQPIYFDPSLNAGSVALQYLFAQLYDWQDLDAAIYAETGFLSVFTSIFGNVWETADPRGIGLNADLDIPVITLPFTPGERWALTGGPHPVWSTGTPWGALDFAPPSTETGCARSDRWIRAATDGVVTRVGVGVVIVDADSDFNEQTGWVYLYLHVATAEKVPVGTVLHAGDPIGHPSCEGGNATGSHLHLARKYNGEWISAAGPLPFNLSGWIPYNGPVPYLGGLIRDNEISVANPYGSGESLVWF